MVEEGEKFLGKVTHYYDKIMVAVVELAKGATIKKGDQVHFKGGDRDFIQTVSSLQIEHKDVEQAKAGDSFGMKVDQEVHEGDAVYKIG